MKPSEKDNQGDTRDLYGDNKYTPLEEEIFFRPLTRRLAQKLKNGSVHPDHISVIGFLLTVLLGVLFMLGWFHIIVIVILLFFCLFFDKLDGDLARAKKIAGRKGQYIDGFLDAVGEVILIMGIALFVHPSLSLALLSVVGPLLFAYHGVAAPFYLDLIPKTHQESASKKPNIFYEIFSYGRAKLFILILILVIINELNLLFFILPLLIVYTCIIFFRNIFIKRLTER